MAVGVALQRGHPADSAAWGCGYRNAEMIISVLVSEPQYREVFPNPGVRAIQSWIEDAWRAGYDPEGRFQLQDKLLGTRKWIGTSGGLEHEWL